MAKKASHHKKHHEEHEMHHDGHHGKHASSKRSAGMAHKEKMAIGHKKSARGK